MTNLQGARSRTFAPMTRWKTALSLIDLISPTPCLFLSKRNQRSKVVLMLTLQILCLLSNALSLADLFASILMRAYRSTFLPSPSPFGF